MRKLNLDILQEGLSGISPTRGAFYREAAIVALSRFGFQSGVILKIVGEIQDEVCIEWTNDIEIEALGSWRDELQIANFGAVGMALLLASNLLEFKNFEEGTIGTGIDFWISKKPFLEEEIAFYNREARLEVSGILSAKKGNTINMRIKQKKKQITKSDFLRLPGWIIVVEFSTPKSKIVKK